MGLRKPPKVRKRTYPSGKTVYEVDFTLNGKRTREVFGTRKDLAEAYAAKVFMESQQAVAGIRKEIVSPSLEVLIDDFMRQKVRRTAKSTQKRYKIYAEHPQTFFKEKMRRVRTIDEITKAQLDAHIDELIALDRANKTLNGHIQFIRSLFEYAVEEERLEVSPAKRLESFPEKNDEAPAYWEEDEVQLILKRVGIFWRDAFAFLYHTGLRKEEFIHLSWKDVNLTTNPPSIVIQGKNDWRTKTNKKRAGPHSLDSFAA